MGASILVVEDDPDYRSILVHILRQAGYHVQEGSNGEEGLAAFAAGLPDLVILDVNLPDTDGFELCRAMRREEKECPPILFCTVRASVDVVAEGMKAGGQDYIIKPFDGEDVLARVASILGRTPDP